MNPLEGGIPRFDFESQPPSNTVQPPREFQTKF